MAENKEVVRGWINGDESGREMLCRVFREHPYLRLPPPFHKVPLRVGNVIELIGSSPSAKTHILMQSAIHCILPLSYGGLGRLVFFIDLDCRFDILRLCQMLRNRIILANTRSTSCSAEMKPDDDELFAACMRRFLYIRCYDSLQFLATLKTLHYQLERERETQGNTVTCMMIDSIGAFHWVDRASTSFHLGNNSRKGLSFQNVLETVVQEIKKLLRVYPMLVIASKTTILGNKYAANTSRWNLKRTCSPGPAVSSVPSNMKQPAHREYMPSVWQSFVTLRVLVQATDDHDSIDKNHKKSVYLSEWLLPSKSFVDYFIVEDGGVFCVS